MFRDNIQKLIDKVDGGIAGVLMGFDGIAIDSYARAGFGDSLPDIQTLAAEFAHLVSQARRTVQSLDGQALDLWPFHHSDVIPARSPDSIAGVKASPFVTMKRFD